MIYLDSSAMTKLFSDEPETAALHRELGGKAQEQVVSSIIAETEVRRAATRLRLSQEGATAVLERVSLAVVDHDLCLEAGLLPGPGLRSLDAIHVVTARRLGVNAFITYDLRQSEAARLAGLTVASPA